MSELYKPECVPMEAWKDPTPEMLGSPVFEVIWQVIKRWDVNVPDAYHGYCGATGNHVRLILDALRKHFYMIPIVPGHVEQKDGER